MFELQGVSRAFGRVRAVAGVDLAIKRGRTTVLIGPSGCGKSTLLRLMNGLEPADAGRVTFDGTPVTAETAQALRRRMGYVIQEGGLFPHLTAAGNAALMAHWLGWKEARVRERLDALAALVRIPSDALARYPAQLSGGQRQRVSLMRALMLDPDALLLDEPLGALDPVIRFELQDELREIFGRLGKTVVLVTHDIAEACFFADEIVLLRDGAVVQRAAPDVLLRAPADAFAARFVSARRGLPGETEAEP
jgi:osmoprotectant transport system ATP-binding protein